MHSSGGHGVRATSTQIYPDIIWAQIVFTMTTTPLPIAGLNDAGRANKSESKTITETLTGEHQNVVVGYTLVRGIGDGEPIASERFSVGGHEWVS